MSEAAIWFDARELVPWDANYLDHPQAQLDVIRDSIVRNGWGSTCVAQLGTDRLIIGHGRLAAYLQLLDDEPGHQLEDAPAPGLVPVRFRDLPDDRAAELAVADNEAARLAYVNEDKLQAIVRGMNDASGDAALARALGMTNHAHKALLREAGVLPNPAKVRSPDPVDPPDEPRSIVGEVYELGPHLLVCGDSQDPDVLALLMDDERAAAVVTDPPFAIYGSSTGVSSSVADDAMVRPFFRAMWRAIATILQVFGHAYVCCDWRSEPSVVLTMKGTHLQQANSLVWDKGVQGLGSKWQNTHERVVFAELLPPQTTMRGKATGHRLVQGRGNVLHHDKIPAKRRLHNAEKSGPLLAEIIDASTRPGEIVADLYGGSGATLIVCAQLGRVCRIAELTPAMCDVIRIRWTEWAEEAGQEPGAGALWP